MAYTTDLKSVARKGLRVQVPPLAPINIKKIDNNVSVIYNRDMNSCKICGKECKNIFCSTKCQNDERYQTYITEWLSGNHDGMRGKLSISKHIRRYLLEDQHHKCAHCGIGEWNNEPIVLEVEHKDGDSHNNHRSNLECICPNCHSQTPTFKNRNIGFGRKSRYGKDDINI